MAPPYVMKYVPFGQSGVAAADTYVTGCSYHPGCGQPNEYYWNDESDCDPAPQYKVRCLHWANKSGGKTSYCPKIGTVTDATLGSDSRSVACTYSSINSTVPLNTLGSYFDTGTVNQISADRCAAKNFTDLYNSSECKTYYGTSYVSELLKRIAQINGGQGRWIGNPLAVSFVNNIMRNNLRTIGLGSVSATDQTSASTLVASACAKYPNNVLCGCYNVTRYKDQCINNSDKEGCKEWVASSVKLAALGANINDIAPQNYFCQSSACVNALNDDTAGIIPTATSPCTQNIQACIVDLSNSSLTDSQISTSCQNAINTGGGNGNGARGSPAINTGGGNGNGSPAPNNGTVQWVGIIVCIIVVLLMFSGIALMV